MESDGTVGSLSSIKEIMDNDDQSMNPKFIQWIKPCEMRTRNVWIDTDRDYYAKHVYNDDFLGDKKKKKKSELDGWR